MTAAEKIQRINGVLQEYFKQHPGSSPIPAKNLMQQFIKAGLFSSEKTLRQFLRDLRDSQSLHMIPFVLAEQIVKNISWFFAPAKLTASVPNNYKPTIEKQVTKQVPKSNTKHRSHSDECYVLNLCDEVLGLSSVRQHRFSFLVGDPSKDGKPRMLPVDGWYEQKNLVIEYNEEQHTGSVNHWDKKATISGINRAGQRLVYFNRRLEVLPKHGIQVIVFSYFDFGHKKSKRLLRNRDEDLNIIREKLKPYKPASIA